MTEGWMPLITGIGLRTSTTTEVLNDESLALTALMVTEFGLGRVPGAV